MEKFKGKLVPAFNELMWPLLKVLKQLGGSASNKTILREFIKMGYPDYPCKNGKGSELAYRLGWAKTYLKMYKALETPFRAVWGLTAMGKTLKENEMKHVHRTVLEKHRAAAKAKKKKEKEKLNKLQTILEKSVETPTTKDSETGTLDYDQASLIIHLVSRGHMTKEAANNALRELGTR